MKASEQKSDREEAVVEKTADTGETVAEDDAAPRIRGIRRATLPEQVANRLRDLIVQSEFAPGQRIRERVVAAELNVSRTPLREALQVLASEGLVELLPNRGAVVSAPSPEAVADMLQVLGVIESFAGERACEMATDAEIAEIRALHFEMLAAFSRGERLAYFKLNQRIHKAIVLASRNQALIDIHERLNARLYRVRYQSNLRNELWGTAVEEHEQLLKALEARDSRRLSKLLRGHLSSTWTKISEIMSEEG